MFLHIKNNDILRNYTKYHCYCQFTWGSSLQLTI